jgi:hypothetical protein
MQTMNKKQKLEKCKSILHKYPINSIIDDTSDVLFLLSIFENHPEWELKQGVGIESISIIKTEYNNRCFQLHRIDGSCTDISYISSINKPSKLQQIKSACRRAISNQIIQFRTENVIYGSSKCPITQEVLTMENTHIDHYDLPFEEMFANWLKRYEIEYLFSKINETADNDIITCFTDEVIIEDFINYQNENSKLRAVSRRANLSTLRIMNVEMMKDWL